MYHLTCYVIQVRCPDKNSRLVLPSNFGNIKDILTIFGTEITKAVLSLSHFFWKDRRIKKLDRTITSA